MEKLNHNKKQIVIMNFLNKMSKSNLVSKNQTIYKLEQREYFVSIKTNILICINTTYNACNA
jgi:hypothetical protein